MSALQEAACRSQQDPAAGAPTNPKWPPEPIPAYQPLDAAALAAVAAAVAAPINAGSLPTPQHVPATVALLTYCLARPCAPAAAAATVRALARLACAPGDEGGSEDDGGAAAAAADGGWRPEAPAGAGAAALAPLNAALESRALAAAVVADAGALAALARAAVGGGTRAVAARDALSTLAHAASAAPAATAALAPHLAAVDGATRGRARAAVRGLLTVGGGRDGAAEALELAALAAAAELDALRSEVAALRALPADTRAAIVELACAVRGGGRAGGC
jgi:hypothetical protein